MTAVYLAIQDRLPWALRQEVKQLPWPSKQLLDEDPIEAHRVAWKGILNIRELLSSCGSPLLATAVARDRRSGGEVPVYPEAQQKVS